MFEVHIEQGPLLEADGLTIGAVTGIQGVYWLDVTIDGMACHAGPTPMDMRQGSPDMHNEKLAMLARGLLGCTYGELMDFAGQLAEIQKGLEPLDGAADFARLLHTWAQGKP